MIFDKLVNIFTAITPCIRVLVMRDVVNLVLVDEFLRHDPWCVCDDLIDPSTVPHAFASFGVGHDRWSFMLFDQRIGAHAND